MWWAGYHRAMEWEVSPASLSANRLRRSYEGR
jgi:hypothetical protein